MVNSNRKPDNFPRRKVITQAEQAILTTLLYSDIFTFPVTKDELWKLLLTEKEIRTRAFNKGLSSLTKSKKIIFQDGYYCLAGREFLIAKRKKYLSEVKKKMNSARLIANKLAVISTISFIGVSGGLAVGNVTETDDIDFFIIVKKNTLFVSRFLILLLLEGFGVRRTRNQKDTANAICVNFLIDETSLAWEKDNRDLYTAREIAQMRPLFVRDDMYHTFLKENMWIRQFVPNISFEESYVMKKQETLLTKVLERIFIHDQVESFFRVLQMSFMKRHQTREIMTKHILAFHPNDYRTKTLEQLKLKMQQIGLLTKV